MIFVIKKSNLKQVIIILPLQTLCPNSELKLKLKINSEYKQLRFGRIPYLNNSIKVIPPYIFLYCSFFLNNKEF